MSRKLDIMVLMDGTAVPDNDPEFTQIPAVPTTEHHVIGALRELGHNVSIQPVEEDVGKIVAALTRGKPDLVFNLTEQFAGDRRFDKNIAALLEILDIPFTGSGAMGLMLCRDKRLCKQLLGLHRIRVPGFVSLPLSRPVRVPKTVHYPLVVKPAFEDSSEGISNASLASNEDALQERVRFVHDGWQQAAIAEEYIEGRELYVGVKFNAEYRKKWNITFGFAELEPATLKAVERICKRVYRVLQIRDYGRIDLRLTADSKLVVLEANPNPDIAYGEEVAEAAERGGISYEQLIARILHLALHRYKGKS
ncbi:MAG: D-alanine--D-alanine ligase family protein [Planctomycetota bacterium]|jgi:D-alanine-D-alanine ligase